MNPRVPDSQLMARAMSIIGEALLADSSSNAEEFLKSGAIISSKIGDLTTQLPLLHLLGGWEHIGKSK